MGNKKQIKKQGNSYYVRITCEDLKLYNLKEGDIVEIDFKPNGK